jgi:antitoxin component of RelBE/YafQ-DinJ toxin-antitoxin module
VLQGMQMTRFRAVSSTVTACIALCLAPFDPASAQMGTAATKQMQDTQRAAQKKARAAKSGATQDQMKTQKETPPASASNAH